MLVVSTVPIDLQFEFFGHPDRFWFQACQASDLAPDCLLFHRLSAQQGVVGTSIASLILVLQFRYI